MGDFGGRGMHNKFLVCVGQTARKNLFFVGSSRQPVLFSLYALSTTNITSRLLFNIQLTTYLPYYILDINDLFSIAIVLKKLSFLAQKFNVVFLILSSS